MAGTWLESTCELFPHLWSRIEAFVVVANNLILGFSSILNALLHIISNII